MRKVAQVSGGTREQDPAPFPEHPGGIGFYLREDKAGGEQAG